MLEIAYLTLDELEMETIIVENDDYVDDDDVVVFDNLESLKLVILLCF